MLHTLAIKAYSDKISKRTKFYLTERFMLQIKYWFNDKRSECTSRIRTLALTGLTIWQKKDLTKDSTKCHDHKLLCYSLRIVNVGRVRHLSFVVGGNRLRQYRWVCTFYRSWWIRDQFVTVGSTKLNVIS